GGELCPRNFGVGLRMSEAGYQAGGIEWACAPEAILWSGGAPLSKSSLPDGLDLNDGWHTMRVAVIGDRITIAFDGVEVASEEISAPSDGRLIAIWSDNVALEIRAVTVAEVSP
ncbi:MAG: hypothetical protein IT336_08035, partial [Thermomicrobiales bacterium]|nr:hypothetical protein [Thermomicrobiales bacterium]